MTHAEAQTPTNDPPVADAGSDQTVGIGATVTLDGSGSSDPENASLTYSWNQTSSGTTVTLSASTAQMPTFTAPDSAGDLVFSLTVNDGTHSATDTVTITMSDSAGICSRTRQVRDKIIQSLSTPGSDCSKVTTEQLATITQLDFSRPSSGNSITSLKSGDFAGLTGLTRLDLERNSLTSLPSGVFAGLTSLSTLDITHNMLAWYPYQADRFPNVYMWGNPFSDPERADPPTVPEQINDPAAGICSRTKQVRDEIIRFLSAFGVPVSDCAGVTDVHLARVTHLYIANLSSGNRITSLKSGDFAGLTGLTRLNLKGNSLTSLPSEVFADLTALRTLDLSGNSLASLPDGVFEDLSALRHLDLEGNSLTSLPSGVFTGLTSLRSLDLTHNMLAARPIQVDNLPASVTVNIWGNPFLDPERPDPPAVPEKIDDPTAGICSRTKQVRDEIVRFLSASGVSVSDCAGVTDAHLATVTHLYIANPSSGNRIAFLKSDDFEGLTGLIYLSLKGNSLTSLPKEVFTVLTALRTLDLSGNSLTSLPSEVFADLTALRTLDLSGNSLASLPDGVFEDLSALRHLDLEGNSLTSLPSGVFTGLTSLRSLDLTHNMLAARPYQVDDLPRSVIVYMWGNPFLDRDREDPVAVPEQVDETKGICSRTKQVRDEIVRFLSDPTSGLDCEGVTAEQLETVTNLYIANPSSGNRITSLKSDDFEGLTGLRHLDLEGNSLTSLPDGVFEDLSALRTLDLEDNSLAPLSDGAFKDLISLRYLDLEGNSLASLPDGVFAGLASLRHLDLEDNLLTSLPDGVFKDLTNLRTLDLTHNMLAVHPIQVNILPNLETLYIWGNPFLSNTDPEDMGKVSVHTEDDVSSVVKVSPSALRGNTLTLVASQDIDPRSRPDPDDFTVEDQANGNFIMVQSVAIGDGPEPQDARKIPEPQDARKIVLTLSSAPAGAVRVTYTPGRNPIQDVTERAIVESSSVDLSPETDAGGCALIPDGSEEVDLGMLFILLMVIPFAVKSKKRTTKLSR